MLFHIKNLSNLLILISVLGSYQLKGDELLFFQDRQKGGWRGFGTGFADLTVDQRYSEIQIDVNWQTASWGFGVMFTLQEPCDGQKIKAVRAKVKSKNASVTNFYVGLATQNNASVEVNRRKALKITNKWQIFEFPIMEMSHPEGEPGIQQFGDGDWQKIKIIKFLFTKPLDNGIGKDVIFIRKPEFILLDK